MKLHIEGCGRYNGCVGSALYPVNRFSRHQSRSAFSVFAPGLRGCTLCSLDFNKDEENDDRRKIGTVTG
jgi:hypothetical protein